MLSIAPIIATRPFNPLHRPESEVRSRGGIERSGTRRAISCLPSSRQGGFEAIGSVISVKKGGAVFNEGEPAQNYYQVIEGTVRVYKLMEDGKRQIVAFALPGDFFGFVADGTYDFSADAITPVTLRRVSKAQEAALFCKDPTFCQRLFSTVRDQLVAAQLRLVVIGRKTAVARVASFLDMLCKRRKSSSSTLTLDLPMSRDDIGDYLGLASETVSRALTQLRKSRVIDLPTPQHVLVRNIPTLNQIAEGELGMAEAA
jgi:CRP-like cAMP-binding protein